MDETNQGEGKQGKKEVQSVRELFEACMDSYRSPAFLLKDRNIVLSANSNFRRLVPTWSGEKGDDLENLFPGKTLRFLGESHQEAGKAVYGSDLAIERIASWKNLALCRISTGPSSEVLDEETLHSQRLVTLGMLAGGVAHDFNNILAGILGHITYLKTVLGSHAQYDESLLAVEDGARKAAGLTRQILEFSKMRSELEDEDIALGGLLLSTTKLLRAALSPKIRIELELGDVEIFVRGKESRLSQAFANVIMNARDANPKDSCIHIRLSLEEDAQENSLPWATVQVRDSGEGMAPDVLSRAFEPYFSTKASKGTGLGLATVRSVLEAAGGRVEVRSQLHVGTEVSLSFPVVRIENRKTEGNQIKDKSSYGKVLGDKNSRELSQGLNAGTHGGARLLVVDDEDTVRNVLGMSLRHLGFEVLLASSGHVALELLASGATPPVDLVLLDMLMPEMGGEEVFAKIREQHPNLSVCIMSGFSSEAAVKNILRQGGKGFIQKPFTIEQLAEKISEILPRAQTPSGKLADGGGI